jgi:hypothetical protein
MKSLFAAVTAMFDRSSSIGTRPQVLSSTELQAVGGGLPRETWGSDTASALPRETWGSESSSMLPRETW